MSENVKRWTTQRPSALDTKIHTSGLGEIQVVSASDYDALLAERDALREAGAAVAEFAEDAIGLEFQVGQEFNCNDADRARTDEYVEKVEAALAAWRAATGEGAPQHGRSTPA